MTFDELWEQRLPDIKEIIPEAEKIFFLKVYFENFYLKGKYSNYEMED